MIGEYLLDTNIISAYMEEEPKVLLRLNQAAFYVPSVVWGELLFGALKAKGKRQAEFLARLNPIMPVWRTLSCDLATARQFAEVKVQLFNTGKPIPENDIWISAVALQYDLTLVSRDAHFEAVAGLKVEKW